MIAETKDQTESRSTRVEGRRIRLGRLVSP